MPRLVTTLLILTSSAFAAAEERAKQATRTIEGRVVDVDGRLVTHGKVYFSVSDRSPFCTKEATAEIGPDGTYRIELKDYMFGGATVPASTARRFTVVATGFHAELGTVPAGGETTIDFRLTPAEWKTTIFRFVDLRNHPVVGAEVDLQIALDVAWETLKSDRDGICRVACPPDNSFRIAVRSQDYLPIEFGLPGRADDPAEVAIPMFDPIRGRVVDPDGRPLKGVKIGQLIAPNYRANVPDNQLPLVMYEMKGSEDTATSDDIGHFDLRPQIRLDNRSRDKSGTFRIFTEPLCFADSTLRNMAFLGVDLKDPLPDYEVVLKPARRVRIPLEHEVATASGMFEGSWDISALLGRGGPETSIRVMGGNVGPRQSDGEWLEAYWPEGRYRLTVYSGVGNRLLEETETIIEVPAGREPLVLPKLRLSAVPLMRLIGKPAPEIEARDLDSGKPIRLADFRGKVVVLDFWGYWCGPCIGAMPELMKIHDQYQGRPVVVLALHDQSVQTREAYEIKLENVRRNIWKGRDLPFRVAVDAPSPDVPKDDPGIAQGTTCSRYGIRGFPTTLVIGPDGVVAGSASPMTPGGLEALIDKVLPNASP